MRTKSGITPGTMFSLAKYMLTGVGAITWGMEGASDDVEGVVRESDEDVSAGGNQGSSGEPFPHAGVDGRESPAEWYETPSSKEDATPFLSSWVSSACLSALEPRAPVAGSTGEL